MKCLWRAYLYKPFKCSSADSRLKESDFKPTSRGATPETMLIYSNRYSRNLQTYMSESLVSETGNRFDFVKL